jgi:hypothetical protein
MWNLVEWGRIPKTSNDQNVQCPKRPMPKMSNQLKTPKTSNPLIMTKMSNAQNVQNTKNAQNVQFYFFSIIYSKIILQSTHLDELNPNMMIFFCPSWKIKNLWRFENYKQLWDISSTFYFMNPSNISTSFACNSRSEKPFLLFILYIQFENLSENRL